MSLTERKRAKVPRGMRVLLRVWLMVLPPKVVLAEQNPREHAAITTSLTTLATPLLQFKGEIPVMQQLTVAPILGAGRYSTQGLNSLTLLVVGGQGIFYPFAQFQRGLQVVADLDFAHSWASSDRTSQPAFFFQSFPPSQALQGDGNRVRAALLIGGKWTGSRGFVGEIQAGVGLRRQWGSVSNGTTERTFDETTWEPRFGVNIGYGF